MQYDVTAVALDPLTGAVIAAPRTDRIDTETNELFGDCEGPWEVEDRFEAFWNRLSPSWEYGFSCAKEKVKVVRVDVVRL